MQSALTILLQKNYTLPCMGTAVILQKYQTFQVFQMLYELLVFLFSLHLPWENFCLLKSFDFSFSFLLFNIMLKIGNIIDD